MSLSNILSVPVPETEELSSHGVKESGVNFTSGKVKLYGREAKSA